jgi:hypothetical protein
VTVVRGRGGDFFEFDETRGGGRKLRCCPVQWGGWEQKNGLSLSELQQQERVKEGLWVAGAGGSTVAPHKIFV